MVIAEAVGRQNADPLAPVTEIVTEAIEPPPNPMGATWRAYTLDTGKDAAAALFQRRYGQPPRFVFVNLGVLLAGPTPDPE